MILWFVISLKIANLSYVLNVFYLIMTFGWSVLKSVLNFSSPVFLNCSADGIQDHVFRATQKVLHQLDLPAHQLHPTLKQSKIISIVKALNRMEMR